MPDQIRVYADLGLWCVTWTGRRYRQPARWWQWHPTRAVALDHAADIRSERQRA